MILFKYVYLTTCNILITIVSQTKILNMNLENGEKNSNFGLLDKNACTQRDKVPRTSSTTYKLTSYNLPASIHVGRTTFGNRSIENATWNELDESKTDNFWNA